MAKQGIPEKKGKVEEKCKREGYEKKSRPSVGLEFVKLQRSCTR